MDLAIRPAAPDDISTLEFLISESVRLLQRDHYSVQQMEGALGSVFGVDTQLIRDGTYFVAEVGSEIVGCGGWSRRKTLFGSDHLAAKDDARLDPLEDAARIRAFFVRPAWARRGIGSTILRACEAAALAHGFCRFELVATLPGEPLYRAHGYKAVENIEVPLPNGAVLPVIRMSKP
jgi:GNAT superfamily N-acetyltransferase